MYKYRYHFKHNRICLFTNYDTNERFHDILYQIIKEIVWTTGAFAFSYRYEVYNFKMLEADLTVHVNVYTMYHLEHTPETGTLTFLSFQL